MTMKKVTLTLGRKKRVVEVYTCEMIGFRSTVFRAEVSGPDTRSKKDADALTREILRKLKA